VPAVPDAIDARGGVDPAGSRGGVHTDLDLVPPALSSAHPLGLVGRDRDQPGSQPGGVAQGAELAPGDVPGDLHGIVGEAVVARDEAAHPTHMVVVLGDDPAERDLIA
jgi:hypothetical protein